MKKTIYLTRGIPASGKTTWARSVTNDTTKRVAKGDLRRMFDHSQVFDSDHAKFLTGVRNQLILSVLANGFNVVVDEMFVKKTDIDEVIDFFQTLAAITIVEFSVAVDVCIWRDGARPQSIGRKRIEEYHEIMSTNTPLLQEAPKRYTMITYME